MTLTRLAGVEEVLVTVKYVLYGSPLRMVRGWDRDIEKVGLRTRTDPTATPMSSTGPEGRPSKTAWISKSMV